MGAKKKKCRTCRACILKYLGNCSIILKQVSAFAVPLQRKGEKSLIAALIVRHENPFRWFAQNFFPGME
jgi:hypothetical protein